MKPLVSVLILLAITGMSPAQANRTFNGVVTDGMCAKGDHSKMLMGSNDAECTIACVDSHGAQYVLFDGKNSYILSDQQKPEKFAGKKVTVTGTLKAGSMTIQMASIAAAK